ncbi:hypothetical protein [Agromyces laixinhei]|uniref:hypothetical protein n=1 Tax=Agromyces laixinhei TaxID=2585717 RepID=UPI001117AB5C|nr:hypothetical protein [Agromyces laixinhei]
MVNDTDTPDETVKVYLALLKRDHDDLERLDAYYVHLAFNRGLMVPDIAARTGLDAIQVQRILASPPPF